MMQWRNWAGDQACRPAAFERPADRDGVSAAVAGARGVVRVAGAGHSFTDAVLTDGTLLSLERMDRALDVDRGSGLVRVQAGITLHADAVRAVRALIDERGFAVPFPLEVRCVAGDDALLSPACGRDTGYVAVHMYRGMEWEPYFRAVEAIMDGLGGRPHWGKRHFQAAGTLRRRYPGWERFAAVRDRLDPGRRFTNAYVERVLGP